MLETESDAGRFPGFRVWVACLGLMSMFTMLAGCSSTGSSVSGSHAGVTLTGHGITEVVLTTRQVFEDHGYMLAGAEPDRMIFERPGTRGEQVKYGSFGSSSVVIRAKVDVQEMGLDSFYLRCDIFSVRDAGQSVLEDETRLILVSSKPYQAMMDEVKLLLAGPAGVEE